MDIKLFKSELKELLKKHNAHLVMSMDGDTHGIFNEKIEVVSGKEKHQLTPKYQTSFDHTDL